MAFILKNGRIDVLPVVGGRDIVRHGTSVSHAAYCLAHDGRLAFLFLSPVWVGNGGNRTGRINRNGEGGHGFTRRRKGGLASRLNPGLAWAGQAPSKHPCLYTTGRHGWLAELHAQLLAWEEEGSILPPTEKLLCLISNKLHSILAHYHFATGRGDAFWALPVSSLQEQKRARCQGTETATSKNTFCCCRRGGEGLALGRGGRLGEAGGGSGGSGRNLVVWACVSLSLVFSPVSHILLSPSLIPSLISSLYCCSHVYANALLKRRDGNTMIMLWWYIYSREWKKERESWWEREVMIFLWTEKHVIILSLMPSSLYLYMYY